MRYTGAGWLTRSLPAAQVLRFHFMQSVMLQEHMQRCAARAGHPVYDMTMVIDMRHGSVGAMNKFPRDLYVSKLAEALSSFYPGDLL